MTIVPGPLASAAPADGVPPEYNFAADMLERNSAGRPRPQGRLCGSRAAAGASASWPTGRRASARRCARSGVRREERILLCLLDTIDWPTAFLGAVKAGVVPIPVNTLMTEDDYRFMLADSRARTLVVSEAIYPKFENLIKSNAGPRARHRLRRACAWPPRLRGPDRAGEPEAYTAPTPQDDICFWLYTSGSTGRPKGAVHVHADLGSPTISMAATFSASPSRTSAIRSPSCSSPSGSAMRSPFRSPPAPPRSCCRTGRPPRP